MPAVSTLRGHQITYTEAQWQYIDTGEPTLDSTRRCGRCDQARTIDGHDACLGDLPGVMNACCGHGQERGAYVQFWDGSVLQGQDATAHISVLLLLFYAKMR